MALVEAGLLRWPRRGVPEIQKARNYADDATVAPLVGAEGPVAGQPRAHMAARNHWNLNGRAQEHAGRTDGSRLRDVAPAASEIEGRTGEPAADRSEKSLDARHQARPAPTPFDPATPYAEPFSEDSA